MSDAKRMSDSFVPFSHPLGDLDNSERSRRASAFHTLMAGRRTVREFASTPVPEDIIATCIRAAGTAPSGAHKQPWHFAAISSPALKSEIRQAAEEEEASFYDHRAPDEWLKALQPFGTNADKPFLEIAPWLIAIFARPFDVLPDGTRSKNYYVQESVGIATGLLIAALHNAGLSTLTHTPSPMGFLNDLLGRPSHERATILLVVGHAADHARVPMLDRNPLDQIASFHGT
ncbi:MAG: nitroreductase family protein [Rhodothermales bacterium]